MIDPAARALVPNELLWNEIEELARDHEVRILGREAGCYGVLITDYPLPPDLYTIQSNGDAHAKAGCVDLLLRIPEGYPHAAPDMFWIRPFVVLAKTNARPAAADSIEPYHGGSWQRFSWHIQGNRWRPVADSLAHTFLPFIERRLWRGS